MAKIHGFVAFHWVSSRWEDRGVASPYCPGGQDWGSFPVARQRQVRACAHRGVSEGGCAPLRSWKILEFLYWIRAIWWILLGKIHVIIILHISIKTVFIPLPFLFFLCFPSLSLPSSLFLPFSFPFFFFFLSSFPFSSLSFLSFPLFPFLFPFFPSRFFSPLPDFWCPGGQSAPLPPHWLRPCERIVTTSSLSSHSTVTTWGVLLCN